MENFIFCAVFFLYRRIGRWLTNITPLLPMFTADKCTFTMKTVPWAMPWKPSLRLRLANKQEGIFTYLFLRKVLSWRDVKFTK